MSDKSILVHTVEVLLKIKPEELKNEVDESFDLPTIIAASICEDVEEVILDLAKTLAPKDETILCIPKPKKTMTVETRQSFFKQKISEKCKHILHIS